MRLLLLHNRLHRAFPELDPYSDDRCRKFISAAQHGWVRRAARIGIILIASACVLVGGGYLVTLAVEAWFGGVGTRRAAVAETLLFLVPLIVAPLAGFVTRDYLLRRRVRWVLRTRGACPACRYSLIGLPVSAASQVTCPECGQEVEVDPSLGELVIDESGMGRFAPSARAFPRPPRIFTPRVVRFLKRAAIATAVVLTIGVPALLAGYEAFLRLQSATAKAEKPGAEALLALIESIQPANSMTGENAWDILQEADAIRSAADLADEEANPVTLPDIYSYADFQAIYIPLPSDADPNSILQNRISEAKARRLLDAYREAGLYQVLDRMALATRWSAPITTPLGESVALATNTLAPLRGLARINAARMAVAQKEGNLEEYISALESSLTLTVGAENQPSILGGLIGVSIEMLIYDRLQALLLSHPSPRWLDAIDAAIARHSRRPSAAFRWEGERLNAIDLLAWVYSEPANMRWGRLSDDIQSELYIEVDAWVGTYARNRNELNAFYRVGAAAAAKPRWQRSPASLPAEPEASLAAAFATGAEYTLRSFDSAPLLREGYAITSALERCYAATGAYPSTLDALVPSFLPSLAVDPWTGKSWGYRPRSADADPTDPRGYILYSFGEDAIDDRGVRARTNQEAWNPRRGTGYDFIINDWTPPEH